MELQDFSIPFACDDGTMTEDTPTYQVGNLCIEASTALGRPLDIAQSYKDLMAEVGFTDIVERRIKSPIGIWPKDKYFKDLGYWNYTGFDIGLEGLLMALLTRGLGWSKDEVLVYCAQVRTALRDPRIHAYIPT